jgi:hypothetical protein
MSAPVTPNRPRKKRVRRDLLATIRSTGCVTFSFASLALLVRGMIEGRFENSRYLGTVAYETDPIGFIAIAGLCVLCAALFAFFARVWVWHARP